MKRRRKQADELYGFNHGMYRQVLYGRLGAERRARLHRAMGERWKRFSRPISGVASRWSWREHFGAAHEWPRALGHLRSALQAAKRWSAHQEALAILDRMMAIAADACGREGGSGARTPEQRAPIYVVMHDARVQETFTRLIEQPLDRAGPTFGSARSSTLRTRRVGAILTAACGRR